VIQGKGRPEMLQIRADRKLLWVLIALIVLPALWVLQIEFTYERNIRHGIPADFTVHRPHAVVMWKV
jgi:hypothetical protein